jgi:uncharacterized protein
VRAQLLDAPRPTELLGVVRRLTLLQIDPTAAIAPSADLVAWSRLGSSYQPVHLQQALEQDRTLFEHNALVRPMSDLGLYLAGAADWPSYERTRTWLRDNDRFRRDILDLLGRSGHLTSRDIPDTSVVPWGSTGWTNNRNVTQMLECLMMKGEIAIVGRVGRERIWDLAERVYQRDVVVPSVDEANRIKNERRLAALGIARQKTTAVPVEPWDVGDAGEPAVVEGVKGEWRVEPALLGDEVEGRTALLSPFDRLVHDRIRTQELFDFEYTLEMYKPARLTFRGCGHMHLRADCVFCSVACASSRRVVGLTVRPAEEVQVAFADFERALSDTREIELTTTGRISGRESSQPVWFVRQGEYLYLLPIHGSDSPWYKNVVKTPAIGLAAGGTAYGARATPVTDPAKVGEVVESFRAKYGARDVASYYTKLDFAVEVPAA